MDNRPLSGLGRSIDELFQKLPGSGEGEEADSPQDPAPPGSPVEARDPGSGSPSGGPPNRAAAPGATAPESEPSQRFSVLVGEYLDGGPEERDSLAPQILAAAEDLRTAGAPDPLADGVVALTLAGGGGDDEEALALARELLEGDAATRITERIGAERDEEVKESLREVAEAHPEVLAPVLAEALAEASDRGVRRSLMDAMGALGEPGRVAALGLLEDHRWYAVRNGVVLLGELGGEDLVQALTVPLGHEDPRIRRETVTALAKLGGEDASLLLVGMLEDGSPEVRAAAATGAGLLRVERAQRVLEGMLEREDSEDVLVPVLRALGQLGDPGPVPAIEKKATGSLFTRPPREVRIAAYRALAAIGTPHARTVLRNGAGDKDPEIQNAVGMILRQMAQAREEARKAGEETGPVPEVATPGDPGRTPTPGPE